MRTTCKPKDLNVSRQTAWQLVRHYLEDGQVVQPRGGVRARATRTDEEMTADTVKIVTDYPAYTLQQMNAELHQRLPNKPRVSLATVARILGGQLIRIKKFPAYFKRETRVCDVDDRARCQQNINFR